MLERLAALDANPQGNGEEIVGIALVGLLLGGIFVFLGSKGGNVPPVDTNCGGGTCPSGSVCDPKTATCLSQVDGGACVQCFQEGVTCCAPWGCVAGYCISGAAGKGSSCLLPCAHNGMVCNPHTNQCEANGVGPWTVDWGPQLSTAIVFLEDVTPIQIETLPTGDRLPFPIDAAVSFTYQGPGGSATVGFSLSSESLVAGLCSYAFSSQSNISLDPAHVPTNVIVATSGLFWPDNCLLCVTGMTFTVWPYVVLPDGPHYGPGFPSLLSC